MGDLWVWGDWYVCGKGTGGTGVGYWYVGMGELGGLVCGKRGCWGHWGGVGIGFLQQREVWGLLEGTGLG